MLWSRSKTPRAYFRGVSGLVLILGAYVNLHVCPLGLVAREHAMNRAPTDLMSKMRAFLEQEQAEAYPAWKAKHESPQSWWRRRRARLFEWLRTSRGRRR